MRAFSRAILASVALFAGMSAAVPAQESAQELADSLQRKYDGVKDFSADFIHAYRGGVLRKEVTERGRLLIKKPGKMRWEYTAPEKKLFVSDGVKIYSYIPADKQVTISAAPAGDQATTPALFLTGKGNLTRDFTATLVEPSKSSPPGTRGLKLVPRTRQPDYDWLVLQIAPRTLQIVGLVTMDAQGGESSLSFTNLQENVRPADKEFTFSIPRGVDVVSDSPAR